jgi:hypothetical protein
MNTRLTDCAKCGAPVVRSTDVGLTLDLHRRQLRRTHGLGAPILPAPISRPRLIELLAGDRHEHTVLERHECPGALVCVDEALSRWMPKDRDVIAPKPVKAVVMNGVPF